MFGIFEEKNGKKIHKAEILEMNFLRVQGILQPDYNEVENHIEKLFDLFLSDITTLDDLDTSYVEWEEMCGDLESMKEKIDYAFGALVNMKRVVEKMRNSDIKKTLLSYIKDMENDLE